MPENYLKHLKNEGNWELLVKELKKFQSRMRREDYHNTKGKQLKSAIGS